MAPNRTHELEAVVEDLKGQVETLNKRIASEKVQLQTAIEMEKRFRSQAQQEAKEANAKADKMQQVAVTLQQDKDALEISLSTAQANEQQTQQAYLSSQAELTVAYESLATLDRERSEIQAWCHSLQEKIDRATIAETTYQSELRTAVTRANELEAQWIAAQANLDASSGNLRLELSARDERLRQLQETHRVEREAVQMQLQAAEKKVEALTASTTNLEFEMSVVMKAGDKQAVVEALRGLQADVYEKSAALVSQGEKLLAQSEALVKVKTALQASKKDVEEARAHLLRGISGHDVDVSLYQHIKLEDLVRLRLKAEQDAHNLMQKQQLLDLNDKNNSSSSSSLEENSMETSINSSREPLMGGGDVGSDLGLGSLGKLEREMRILRSRNKRLTDRTVELEKELHIALGAMDDVKALKEKTAELAGRQRTEKELRSRSEDARQEANDKIVALSEHIEKLMIHLKHEAAAKTKALESLKHAEEERQALSESSTVLTKKNAAKDKLIQELEQGSKILEDQLRLMDEKYIELRNKLDWTRTTLDKEKKKLQHELNTLRCKWQMAMDTGQLPSMNAATEMSLFKPLKSKKGLALNESSRDQDSATKEQQQPRQHVSSNSPVKGLTFEIPKLPQTESENGTPWSDAKLDALQRQFHDKKNSHSRQQK